MSTKKPLALLTFGYIMINKVLFVENRDACTDFYCGGGGGSLKIELKCNSGKLFGWSHLMLAVFLMALGARC
jgi:hypothetical protein